MLNLKEKEIRIDHLEKELESSKNKNSELKKNYEEKIKKESSKREKKIKKHKKKEDELASLLAQNKIDIENMKITIQELEQIKAKSQNEVNHFSTFQNNILDQIKEIKVQKNKKDEENEKLIKNNESLKNQITEMEKIKEERIRAFQKIKELENKLGDTTKIPVILPQIEGGNNENNKRVDELLSQIQSLQIQLKMM